MRTADEYGHLFRCHARCDQAGPLRGRWQDSAKQSSRTQSRTSPVTIKSLPKLQHGIRTCRPIEANSGSPSTSIGRNPNRDRRDTPKRFGRIRRDYQSAPQFHSRSTSPRRPPSFSSSRCPGGANRDEIVSSGRLTWNSFRIAKQADAAARCFSVCPLRIPPSE